MDNTRLLLGLVETVLGKGKHTSKYNYAEAAQFFIDALKINEQSARAHLGRALNKRIGGGDEMNAALTRALKINPRYVEARTLAAALDLEAERFTSARTQIEEALATNPRSLEAHALRAPWSRASARRRLAATRDMTCCPGNVVTGTRAHK